MKKIFTCSFICLFASTALFGQKISDLISQNNLNGSYTGNCFQFEFHMGKENYRQIFALHELIISGDSVFLYESRNEMWAGKDSTWNIIKPKYYTKYRGVWKREADSLIIKLKSLHYCEDGYTYLDGRENEGPIFYQRLWDPYLSRTFRMKITSAGLLFKAGATNKTCLLTKK